MQILPAPLVYIAYFKELLFKNQGVAARFIVHGNFSYLSVSPIVRIIHSPDHLYLAATAAHSIQQI